MSEFLSSTVNLQPTYSSNWESLTPEFKNSSWIDSRDHKVGTAYPQSEISPAQLFIARCQLEFPSTETLQQQIERDRQRPEAQDEPI